MSPPNRWPTATSPSQSRRHPNQPARRPQPAAPRQFHQANHIQKKRKRLPVATRAVLVKQKARPVAGTIFARVPDPAIWALSTTQTAALPHRQTLLSTKFRSHGRGMLTPSRNCGIGGVSRSTPGTCVWFRLLLRNDSLPSASGNGRQRSVRLGPSRAREQQGRAQRWQRRE